MYIQEYDEVRRTQRGILAFSHETLVNLNP